MFSASTLVASGSSKMSTSLRLRKLVNLSTLCTAVMPFILIVVIVVVDLKGGESYIMRH
jgi:hypothetical protein